MSEILDIGDVVVLKSDVGLEPIIRKEALPNGEIVDFVVDRGAIKMTVESVASNFLTLEDSIVTYANNTTKEIKAKTLCAYEVVDQYDVEVVYFHGGSLTRERMKHGSLAKISG
jgi:hypothetical protein